MQDDALTIDLAELNDVNLSEDGATVVVGAGARLGLLYQTVASGAPGKAVVGGTCPPVGVGGLILGTPESSCSVDACLCIAVLNSQSHIHLMQEAGSAT